MNLTTRFTEEFVSLAKSYSDDADEPTAPEGGGRFADYAMISLHGLRIFLEETYEMIIDRLEVMRVTDTGCRQGLRQSVVT